MKRITLLGATGSIGLRTLEIVSSFPEEFGVAGLAARGSNVELIADLCRKYTPDAVALLDEGAMPSFGAGAPVPDEPRNSVWPFGSLRSRPLALSVPFLAWKPSTMICVPGSRESFVKPRRNMAFGVPPSIIHCSTVPD
jgi:hypothetical protein